MKKLLAISLVLVVFASVALGAGWAEQKKFAIGTKHGAAACTVNLGNWLFGTSYARFSFRGDTIVDTVDYYHVDVQLKPFPGSFWSSSIALVSDSITLNSEGSTKYVSDTLAVSAKYISSVGSLAWEARMILTPTEVAGKAGIKNCTAWVTRYK